jgi:hypothetical protein
MTMELQLPDRRQRDLVLEAIDKARDTMGVHYASNHAWSAMAYQVEKGITWALFAGDPPQCVAQGVEATQ